MTAPYNERRKFVDDHPYAIGITGGATAVACIIMLFIFTAGTAATHVFGTMPLVVLLATFGVAFLGLCHLVHAWHHRP